MKKSFLFGLVATVLVLVGCNKTTQKGENATEEQTVAKETVQNNEAEVPLQTPESESVEDKEVTPPVIAIEPTPEVKARPLTQKHEEPIVPAIKSETQQDKQERQERPEEPTVPAVKSETQQNVQKSQERQETVIASKEEKVVESKPTAIIPQSETLMTINGKAISAEEFLYIYEKNNQAGAIDPKTMEEYLDMFINFKLKVTEAESQGIDTTEAFKKELKGYRAQATPKYMQDEAAMDSLIELSWRHMAKDRRAAHIAIQCPATADSAAQADALAKINEAYERVTLGKQVLKGKGKKAKLVRQPKEAFDAVARELSTDPNVQQTGGELGWITPFRYVYPLEEAVYGTELGAISAPFRTQYGWHIVLVEEEREHREVKASHIMKMVPADSLNESKKALIDSIAKVVNKDNFAEVAKQESDDRGSSTRGGELGWFGKGVMVKEFEETAFGLEDGAISAPFRTQYGWHILYKESERGIQPLDSMRTQIDRQVKRDERSKEADKSFIRKTRAEYNLPTTMTDAEVKAYADEHLEEKYPDLKNLVQEYHDGILLFEVSLREVWDKAAKDTAGLETYFAANKKKYTWEKPHFKGWLLQCKDKNSAKAAQAIIKSAHPDSVQSYIAHRVNQDTLNCVKAQRGLWEQGKNPAVDAFGLKIKDAEFTPKEQLPYVVCVGKKLKAPAAWDDEKGKVTTDYQDFLEAEWIKKLREKYPVVINEEVWAKIKK